jgi:hypothetical protein
MTITAPLSVTDPSVNGVGQDADPVTQLVEAAERYKSASQEMAVAANAAVEAEQVFREADCAAQDAHNKAWEAHLAAGDTDPSGEMGFTAPPSQPSDTDLNGVAKEAEWAKLRYGMADAANKRTSLSAENAQAQLAVVEAVLLSLACSLPTVGYEPANPHLQLAGTTEP